MHPSSLLKTALDMPRGLRGMSSIAAVSVLLTVPSVGRHERHASQLPFGPGERLTYQVYAKGMGSIGQATMSVSGPVDVRGTETWLLRSQTTAGFGPFKGTQLSESWFDPVAQRSLRFHERERRFLSTRDTHIEIFPNGQTWTNTAGDSGASPTNVSLDELSFIYYLRLLPSSIDTVYQLNRHFDAVRNPVEVRVTRGDTVSTGIGTFDTILMEMHVHDARRYRGEGIIRVYLSDDRCRIPVRIDSNVPGVGAFVLTLRAFTDSDRVCDLPGRLSQVSGTAR